MTQQLLAPVSTKTSNMSFGNANATTVLAKTKTILGKVRVVHGSNEGYYEISGKDVGHARKALRDVFNIPATADAFVNGVKTADDFVLEAMNTLEFSKLAGDKG